MVECIRVYNDGSMAKSIRFPHEVDEWIKHNRLWRFGCALFVNGECKYRGYLSQERCDEISLNLRNGYQSCEPSDYKTASISL